MGELSVLSSALGAGGWEVSRSSLLSVLQCKLGEGGEGRKQKLDCQQSLVSCL